MGARPEPANVSRTDTPQPDLSVRDASQQAVRRHQFIGVYLVHARLDVNCYKLAIVASSGERANVALVELIAALGEVLFAVAGLSSRHQCAPDVLYPFA